ncbi:cytosine deaminase [Mycobacterium sp. E2699]|uniref:amidohydrolase family protein n=1 Tax=Mycobacterium sp. E2699 TaxID=1834137 RepID=UPI0007FFB1AD|nr:amidohydrolase family protein [Mycobacterium sp. E2699]OBH04194.1 cytosine deaminase [Mycobacterium sp. E2699]
MRRTLLRGARVITMAPHRPDTESLDILVEDDRIASLGDHPDSDGAEIVDLSGRIVIPGLVNAHLHTWQTALRCVGADWTLPQYLRHVHGDVARRYSAEDIYIANLVGALNQINCGITTLGDWCHNNRTPEHADAAVDALRHAGIRAVFFHGIPDRSADTAHPLHEIDRLLDGPFHDHSLVSLGMAISGPQYSTPDVAVTDFRAAKDRNLVVSMHQSGGEPAPGWEAVRTAGLFGPRTNIVHGCGLTAGWIKALGEAGVTFTITPENELSHGHGTPITGPLLRAGVAPSVGTDTETASSGHILTGARIALAHQRGLEHDRTREATGASSATNSTTGRQALSWATFEGARALSLAEHVGQIQPGMQADLVVIDAAAINLWPSHDAIAAVLCADISNIEAVMIAGRWRKRNHRLVGVELAGLRDRLLASGRRLLRRPTRR